MIPVTQTKRGGWDAPPEERGDCFDACLASILEVPLSDTPCPHRPDWWEVAQQTVMRHGYRLVWLFTTRRSAASAARKLGPIYWLAGVPSLNLPPDPDGHPAMHVIVMHGGDVVHDPSLGNRYPLGPADFVVHDALILVPLDQTSRRQHG